MRIDLELRHLAPVTSGLRQVEGVYRSIAQAQAGLKPITTRASGIQRTTREVEGLTKALKDLRGTVADMPPMPFSGSGPGRAPASSVASRETAPVTKAARQPKVNFDADRPLSEFAGTEKPPRAPRVLEGPFSREARRARELREAFGTGDEDRVRDARSNLFSAQAERLRAEKRMAPPKPLNPFKPLQEAVMTSRFGMAGGAVQPLVGRSLAAVGMGGAAGPVGLAIAGTVAALATFKDQLEQASDSARSFGSAATTSGGSPATVSALRGMGMRSDQIAPIADALRQRLSDPNSLAALYSKSGPQMPMPFGSTDNASILRTEMEGLRTYYEEGNLEEQLRRARMLGIETMLDEINVSREVWQAKMRDIELSKELYSPRLLEAQRDYAAGQQRIAHAWEDFRFTAFSPFLKPGANLLHGGATGMRDMGTGMNAVLRDLQSTVQQARKHPFSMAAGAGLGLVRSTVEKELGRNPIFKAAAPHLKGAAPYARLAGEMGIGAMAGGPLGGLAGSGVGALLAYLRHRGEQEAMKGGTSGMSETEKLQREQAQALWEILQVMRAGMSGGGKRARGAFPSQLTGLASNEAIMGTVVRKGAIVF